MKKYRVRTKNLPTANAPRMTKFDSNTKFKLGAVKKLKKTLRRSLRILVESNLWVKFSSNSDSFAFCHFCVLFRYISGTESICRGKWKTGGVHAAKSKQSKCVELICYLKEENHNFTLAALVLGIYDETMQPGQAASIVEKMADYLTTQNY